MSELVSKALTNDNDIFRGHIGSYEIDLDFGDELQRQIWFGIYSPEEVQVLEKNLSEGSVFFDLGANVGFMSFIASQLVGTIGQVHAFEPIPNNLDHIKNTIQHNNVNNITINAVAVGDKAGQITIYEGDDSIGNSGWASAIKTDLKYIPREVEVITIDDYISSNKIQKVDLIKIDIEGHELAAFRGMTKTLELDDAPKLIYEINNFLLEKQRLSSADLTTYIAEKGYKQYLIGSQGLHKIDPSEEISGVQNIFCTK